MTQPTTRLKSRERDAILKSLRAGVTPTTGLQHIQVGRVKEVQAMISDIERIADGGSSIRFIIGDYGSGKSFFLLLVRAIALGMDLVTMHADLAPDRRLHATKGQARNLYAELAFNMATRTRPGGKALPSVVEKFLSKVRSESKSTGNSVRDIIETRLNDLSELVGGYDFARVVESYWEGYESDNENLKNEAIRWLRGEFSNKTDAKKALGVSSFIDDANFYDSLKLMSLFVQQAGYKGLLVNLDEMVNLYKLNSGVARRSNYEQILRILNDCLQGSARNIGFLFGGTPEFLYDPRKGLYSYEALQTRLAENSFAKQAGVVDYTSPTLNLPNLTPEELYILLTNLRHVFASGDPKKYILPDTALHAFLQHCSNKIGEAYFRTPRNTIKAFIDLLSILEQNPEFNWSDLIESIDIQKEIPSDIPIDSDDDGLVDFKI